MTELGKIKAEITDLEKKLLTLHQGPQDRRALEKIIKHEKQLNDLRIIEKRLTKSVNRQTLTTQVAELQAKIDEWNRKIVKVHEEITVFAKHVKADPLLDEIAGKFGLHVFNKAKGLFNKIDNLSSRMRHNLEEIQRLNLEIEKLS
jgi:peptidoglycan hydrolase CwlO-like protein